MKNHLKSLLWLPILMLAVFGCRSCDTIDSSKLDPSEVYSEYWINASGTATEVNATFRVSGSTGTTIALVEPSKVEYNGKPMTPHLRTPLGGSFYSASSDSFVGSNIFVLTDSAGREHRASADFAPIGITADTGEVSRSKGFEIRLSRPLAANERLSLKLISDTPPPISDTGNSANAQQQPQIDTSIDIDDQPATGSISVTVNANTLAKFAVGKAQLSAEVSSTASLPAETVKGGTINYRITSETIRLNVIK